jgi:hypothetical protein
MAQVTVLVERQQRVLAERVAQRHRVGLAGLEDRWVIRGGLLDERRIAESTTFSEDRITGGEDIAAALAAAAHPPHRRRRGEEHLGQRRQPRPWRRQAHGLLVP